MKLSETEKAIILGIHGDARRIAAQPWAGDGIQWGKPLGRYRVAIEEAREGIVPLEAERWLGHGLDGAGRRAFCRTIENMAAAGLVLRHGELRCSHLSLTPKGRQVAELVAQIREKELAADA